MILALIVVAAIVGLATIAEWQWRRRVERGKWLMWVREFRDRFPDRCPVCSFTRWGREMGMSAAYRPAPRHFCPEEAK